MLGAIWLCDDQGDRQEHFPIGRTIYVAGHGLRPNTLYEFRAHGKSTWDKRTLLACYTTNRHGDLPLAVLVPYVGMLSTGGLHSLTLAEACKALPGDTFVVGAARHGRRRAEFGELKYSVALNDPQRWLHACDEEGRLRTGLVQGEGEGRIQVALRHFPAGCVRIYLVRRQFGWRIGDAIRPVHSLTVRHDGAEQEILTLADSSELPPGSYQFIGRVFQAGQYDADDDSLLENDVVSDRRFASVVIRSPFNRRFGHVNGLVLTPEVAGHPLPHRPYFQFVNNFPKGTDVYAALDPDALPAGLVSQRAAIYVIRHKTAGQWASSTALDDISGPAMTATPKVVPIVPGCVNWNTTLVWSNPLVAGKYDIAIDFGNNPVNPADFASDASLDPPLDMIDGYVRVGFYVTEDPSLPGPYADAIGQYDYALGSVPVPSTDAGPTPTDSLPLTATVRYPALTNGVGAVFAAGAFPLVVIMHGNSGYDTSYLGYDYLLDHLAGHGFVAMSIYAPVGVMIETRARAILAHIGIMAQNNVNPGLFNGHIDLGHIGIAGHSRGGEAVVRAARINTTEALGWQIQGGASIAPTDYHHYGDPGIPLLVIYGSNDGDVAGTWPDRTCFDIYDEAGRPRSFVFVYGATHDQFNTVWAPTSLSVESEIAPSDIPKLITLTEHQNVAKGYVTAYMQAHLMGRDEQLEYFTASLKPSLTGGIEIHTSHQAVGTCLIDDFEQSDPHVNTLGGGVTGVALSALSENALRTLDAHSPHVTSGGGIAWQNTAGIYLSQLPPAFRDVSGYEALSFRVTQKYSSLQNPPNQSQDLFVRLTDGVGKTRAIRTSVFTNIPYPYERGYADLIKSALKTIRIPLVSYTIANLGAQDVDLTNIVSVSFEFNANATGEIEIDDIEFSA